jgi:formate-dependent phosphoribosylglycinamide formyltransferase (GAR transformylase)
MLKPNFCTDDSHERDYWYSLQSSAFKVLLLGSGELGKEVVISLQRLGVEVHAADRYDHAPQCKLHIILIRSIWRIQMN